MQNELNCSLSLELYLNLYYVITCTQSLRFPEGFFLLYAVDFLPLVLVRETLKYNDNDV